MGIGCWFCAIGVRWVFCGGFVLLVGSRVGSGFVGFCLSICVRGSCWFVCPFFDAFFVAFCFVLGAVFGFVEFWVWVGVG